MVLLEHCSDEATKMFIEYYTGVFCPKQDAVVVTSPSVSSKPSGFASSAVQNLAALLPLPYMAMSSSERPSSSDQKTETHIIESVSNDAIPDYDVPRPRTAFSAFVDHPHAFVQFLEACVDSKKLKEEDKSDLYTTLFEMYLREANENEGSDKLKWEEKAKALAQSRYVSHLLHSCLS